MTYAGFWKRTAAYWIDGIIYGLASSLIGQVVGVGLMGIAMAGKQDPSPSTLLTLAGIGFLVQVACYLAYYVWPESSAWQATIGKKILGLKVTDLNGQRISFMRALGRNLAMIVSTLILFIGYFMCAWTEKKQCLHDSLADCLVVDTTPDKKQGCIIGVIAGFMMLLAGALVLGILAAVALPQYTQAVEKARATKAITATAAARTFQQLYYQEHGRYATRWEQLKDFSTCAGEASSLCNLQDFTLELEEQGVAAQRTNGTYHYRLFRAYDPADKRRDLVCVSKDENTKSFCQNLTKVLAQ